LVPAVHMDTGLCFTFPRDGGPSDLLQGPGHVPQAAAPAGVHDLAPAGRRLHRRLDGHHGLGAARSGHVLPQALDGMAEAVAELVWGIGDLDAHPDCEVLAHERPGPARCEVDYRAGRRGAEVVGDVADLHHQLRPDQGPRCQRRHGLPRAPAGRAGHVRDLIGLGCAATSGSLAHPGYRNLIRCNPFRTPFKPDSIPGRSRPRMPGLIYSISTPSSGMASNGTAQSGCLTS